MSESLDSGPAAHRSVPVPHAASVLRAVPGGLPAAVSSLSTLDVRWIRAGNVPSAMTEWFGRFPSISEVREDSYLIHPGLHSLSVKIRGLTHVELKLGQVASRTLGVGGVGRVDVMSCEKWSFQVDPVHTGVLDAEKWKRVKKERAMSWFSEAGAPLEPSSSGGKWDPACSVELTDVEVDGKRWWTIALEAIGSTGRSHAALEATASVVFGDPLPDDGRLSPSEATPYSEWIGSLPREVLVAGAAAQLPCCRVMPSQEVRPKDS